MPDLENKQNTVSAELKQSSLDLGFAAMSDMLNRLSLGDPDVRVVLPNDIPQFCELEELLNRLAEFIKGQVEDSHEAAIGLCEHYETLLKLASGELESRASTSSSVELISKLGELINRQADAFQDVLRKHEKAEEERERLHDQLHHAQKLDSIGQLAGGIAHEFNNILAAILGYAGILEMRLGKDSPSLRAVHHIISASEKAASLTRGMLTFS
ncbi:MAG: histidine kinase dimerization/phospho-acceptor domain-containing protein, partial [Desulfuromonadaceae bacterium]|nr:histidine kinase dimerization/phospho-acceptor domain-containing protein [Desulfuromonadaceae bacterium]